MLYVRVGGAYLILGLRATTLFIAALLVVIRAIATLRPHLGAKHLLAFARGCRGRRSGLRRAGLWMKTSTSVQHFERITHWSEFFSER